MAPTTDAKGSCLCGDVRYSVRGPMRSVVYCHCSQCRKTSGHFVAATAVSPDFLVMQNETGLRWYRSSTFAERGFCARCGASVFWKPDHGEYVAIMAGTLDTPTNLRSREHLHTADASDYYELADDLPKFPHDHADLWKDESQ